MKFSLVQQKECIEVGTGKFLGYIMDAFVNDLTGNIEYFICEQPKKFYEVFQGKGNIRKIYYKQIVTIGHDVILIRSEAR